jgi:predicted Zn-dependent protease
VYSVYGADLRVLGSESAGKSVYCEYLFSCVFSHLQPICNREAASSGDRRSLGKGPRATAFSQIPKVHPDEERRLDAAARTARQSGAPHFSTAARAQPDKPAIFSLFHDK